MVVVVYLVGGAEDQQLSEYAHAHVWVSTYSGTGVDKHFMPGLVELAKLVNLAVLK